MFVPPEARPYSKGLRAVRRPGGAGGRHRVGL